MKAALELDREARPERLVYGDAYCQIGLLVVYRTRRGKLDSVKSLLSREVQETYARSTMLKIPSLLAPKASLRDAQATN